MQYAVPIVAVMVIALALYAAAFLIFNIVIPWGVVAIAVGIPAGILIALFRAAQTLSSGAGGEVLRPVDVYTPPAKGRVRDFAWPHYLFGQVHRDARTLLRQLTQDVRLIWVLPSRALRDRLNSVGNDGTRLFLGAISVVLAILVGAGLLGATVGLVLGCMLVLAVFATATAIGYAVGAPVAGVLNLYDALLRRLRRASVFCPACHYVADRPAYRCPGATHHPPEAGLHMDLHSGFAGLLRRRCGCGTRIPTTAFLATRLLDVVCPWCSAPLARGAGARRAVRITVAGAAGAGSSKWATDAAGPAGRSVDIGPFPIVVLPTGRHHTGDMTILDPGDARLHDLRRQDELRVLEFSHAMAYIIDPFSIPKIRSSTPSGNSPLHGHENEGPARLTFDTITQMLHARAVELNRQPLAIILSKVDRLRRYPAGLTLNTKSVEIRTWLREAGLEHFIVAAEREFRTVRYFTSAPNGTGDEPAAPLRWLMSEFRLAPAHTDGGGAGIPDVPFDVNTTDPPPGYRIPRRLMVGAIAISVAVVLAASADGTVFTDVVQVLDSVRTWSRHVWDFLWFF